MCKDGRISYEEVVEQCKGCYYVEQSTQGHYNICNVVLYPQKQWTNRECRYKMRTLPTSKAGVVDSMIFSIDKQFSIDIKR